MAQVNVKPLADRVLVKPAEVEQKTASGIIIPDTAKEKPMTGEKFMKNTRGIFLNFRKRSGIMMPGPIFRKGMSPRSGVHGKIIWMNIERGIRGIL